MKSTLILALALAAALTACGGGEDTHSTTALRACAELSAAQPAEECKATALAVTNARRTALAAPNPEPLSAKELLNWAERAYPDLFPGHKTDQVIAPFTFRHYPETGNYAGLGNGSIYLAGPVVGQPKGSNPVPVLFDSVSKFTDMVRKANDPQGLFVSMYGLVLIEEDGTTWGKWEPQTEGALKHLQDAALGTVTSADGRDIAINLHSMASYDQKTYAITGSYEPKAKMEVTMKTTVVAGANQQPNRSFLFAYDTAYDKPMVPVPTGAFTTVDFYSGQATRFTISATGFTGTSGAISAQCSFAGQFAATPKGYQRVAITFGNTCAVPNGTKGTGIITRYSDGVGGADDVYLLMTTQMGLYGEQPFVAFITVKP